MRITASGISAVSDRPVWRTRPASSAASMGSSLIPRSPRSSFRIGFCTSASLPLGDERGRGSLESGRAGRRRSAGPAVGIEPVHARDRLVFVPRQVPRDDACSPVRDRDILGREALAQHVVDREQVVRRRPSELDERMRYRRVDCCPDAGRSPAARGGIQSPGDPVAVERVHPRQPGAAAGGPASNSKSASPSPRLRGSGSAMAPSRGSG